MLDGSHRLGGRLFLRFRLGQLGRHSPDGTQIGIPLVQAGNDKLRGDGGAAGVTHTDRDKWEMRESRDGGATCYVGSRSSRQFLRVYNKGVESGGQTDSIRWELEFKKEAAEIVSGRLVGEHWQGVFSEHLVQVVDFRERSGRRRGDRSRRLGWFEAIVGGATKATLRYPRPARTLEEAETWIWEQVAVTLATVVEARGGDLDYVANLLEDGRRRQKARHRALLGESTGGSV